MRKSNYAALSVALAVSVYTVVLGIIYPYLSVNLSELGAPANLIGINASMVPIGLLIASVTYRHFLTIMSPFQIAVSAILISACILVLIFFFERIDNFDILLLFWIPLCISLGFTVNGLFIIGEAWINRLASNEMRGRILGLYTTALIAGYGVGPLFIGLLGHDGLRISVASIVIILFALLPMIVFRKKLQGVEFKSENRNGASSVSNLSFARRNFLIVLCFASIAIFDNGAVSFMPLYFSDVGLDIQLANQYLALVIFGGAAFQPLVGFIADKVSNGAVILVSSLMTLAIAFVVYIDLLPQYISVLLVLWGGFAFSNYTMALKELGDRYDDESLVVGSAVLAMTWSLVTIAGLPLIGIGVDIFGFSAFPFLLCTIYPIAMIVILTRIVSASQQSTR